MVTRVAKAFVRNVAGYALMVAGLCLSLPMVPGPGTVLIFLGLALADWPGKLRFFRWLHTFRWFAAIDGWCHHRFGYRMPEHDHHRRLNGSEKGPATSNDVRQVLYDSAPT